MHPKTLLALLTFGAATALAGCGNDAGGGGGTPEGNDTAAPSASQPDPTAAMAGMGGGPVSSAAPAPCATDDDCPAGVACVPAGGDGLSFCDVTEMQAP